MAIDYQLRVKPVKVTELPPEDKLIAQAHSVLDTTDSWNQGKTYHNIVKTSSRAKFSGETANWHCRVSEHSPDEATFDDFWSRLAVNKGQNEMKYVSEIKKATLIKQISPSQAIWSMYYHFPAPVSPRVFTVLQTIQLKEDSPRTGIIVSIAVDLSADPSLAKLEEKGVHGHYVSVERIQELDNGKIEWRLATSSRAEGNIPQFLTERSMATSISRDVPGFLTWLKSEKEKASAVEAPAASSPAA
ncbi:hypothetical protein PHLGIDRAFT_98205 [Phlebiopsis gigantea 11061_1 CR5-6]|uniref:DUF3074 domain-containing protein n=1 Tax=Phlebiopsis gigantea (strain 11061_1 CR5-6) TaxID=745531 RepID=A0A0C3S791_PHLG1|nr:hypothetical protein PHLGIDRAFT_98205 [Phlebiopsis gigantea 11061_1 CR5-6]